MQEIVIKPKPTNGLNCEDLPIEDKQNLVDVFAWLIQEDKEQNPALYQP
jgi:hypothetical protein